MDGLLGLVSTPLRRRIFRKQIWILRETSRPDSDYSLASLDYHRCIFFHVPKTAGVSVSRALFGNLAAGHIDVPTARMVFGRRRFDSYFKFCFVRDPWDRLVSTFFYLRDGGIEGKITPWVERHILPHSDFRDFVRYELSEDLVTEERHLRPQHTYVSNEEGVQVDFVGRYERLHEGFTAVAERLAIDATLQRLNVSHRGDFRDYYDAESRAIVAEVYRRDIDMFGYDSSWSQIL